MKKILIVDDDDINLKMASKILKPMYKVVCVTSGSNAYDYLKRDIPDLILLDVHMPGIDGFEVIEYLKSNYEYENIPVIFLTADEERETEVWGFKAGALDFITKPFIPEIMLQRVGRILELSMLQKNLQEQVEMQTEIVYEKQRKFERLSVQVMKALAKAIDAKDRYTNGHSIRVAKYAKMLADRANKSKKEQDEIYYLGLLHDIGKIGIPDEIINKPAKLTEEEYEIVKKHSILGSEILQGITEIESVSVGAKWHHERYDGKGYPDGLSGDDIPEVARIIGVADAYDAMTSMRSYRGILSQEKVRQEIIDGLGTQFDPIYGKIMLEIMDEDKDYELKEML